MVLDFNLNVLYIQNCRVIRRNFTFKLCCVIQVPDPHDSVRSKTPTSSPVFRYFSRLGTWAGWGMGSRSKSPLGVEAGLKRWQSEFDCKCLVQSGMAFDALSFLFHFLSLSAFFIAKMLLACKCNSFNVFELLILMFLLEHFARLCMSNI